MGHLLIKTQRLLSIFGSDFDLKFVSKREGIYLR